MADKGVIQWPLSTSPGERASETRGRLINCYAEPLGEESGAVWKRSPGASSYGSESSSSILDWIFWGLVFPFNPAEAAETVLPTGVFRGGIFVNGIIYAVFGTDVYTIIEGGSFTKIGSVGGTDKVFLARNNRAPVPDICLVCSAGVYVLTDTSISAYPDVDVGAPDCVVGAEGFFIFGYGNGDMVSTDVNTTNINLLNLARNETNPNSGVTQIVFYQGQLYSFGESSCEIWGTVGGVNATGFPFTKVGYNVVPGLIMHHAVAGSEPEFGQPFLYVGSDHTVRWMVHDNPQKISPPQLDRLIERCDITTLEAAVYVSEGIPFWELSSSTFTWVFNCLNQKWHERKTYLLERSRFTGSVFAFDKWLMGDTQAEGRLLEIDGNLATEADLPIVPVIESLPVSDFPIYIGCPRADFEFSTGTGIAIGHDPDQTDPFCEVSWSDDGGQTWKAPRFVPLGRQGLTFTKITVWRTGLTGAQGRRWRLSVPSNVHLGFIGGNMRQLGTGYP